MTEEELERIERDWSKVCPSCDAGISMNCMCPQEDPRGVIGRLLEHINDLENRLHFATGGYS